MTIEYLDLGDFLVIAEEVLGVPAEDIARRRGSISRSRRCKRRRPSSVASSSIRISRRKLPSSARAS